MLKHEAFDADAPELRLLADVRREHAEPDADTIDRLRHAVAHATRHPASSPPRTRRPWRVGIPIAVTASVVAALAVAGTLTTDHQGERPRVATTARSPLVSAGDDAQVMMTLAARVTLTAPALAPHPGQYVYRRTTSRDLGAYTFAAGTVNVFTSQQRQDWLDPRRGLVSARYIATERIVGPVTPQDARLAAEVGFDLHAAPKTIDSDHPEPGGKGEASSPPRAPGMRNPTPAYLNSLPTDPVSLLATIRRAASAEGNVKWSTDKTAFDMVRDLISWGDPLLSPQLRAALYRAVALMPGVRRVPGATRTDDGHTGVAIGFAEGNVREEIVFDPVSLRPLGARDVTLTAADGVPAGTVISTSSFTFAVVDGVGQTS